ncbi:hypothetical protein CDN99_19425 [Roseateles aquatilis]|uniref:Peptidase M61 catalytic domain-containing protein n=2 Tax=Roseateles aquatilis TaxID=431061 RepID=A0A246J357_9BURK|nr:hypothetical protein CDN99_19425 [Roseateles aquatilis]
MKKVDLSGWRRVVARAIPAAPVALLALAGAGPASAGELLIEQGVAADGTLLVRYTPPDGVRELPLFNRSSAMATVWGEMVAPVDRCATVALKPRPTITLAEGCASVAFRVTPRVLSRSATYEPAFPVGPTAVMGYTGYYAAAVPGHALRWRWTPGEGAHAVVAGRISSQSVDRVIGVDEVALALKDEGGTAAGWSALAANEYVFVGKADVTAMPGGVLIHDGALDAPRLGAVRSTLEGVTQRLARAYGVVPAGPWAVVAAASPAVPNFHGDVTAGRMMSLRFNDATPKDVEGALRQTRLFVSHELTHWWDTGIYRTDQDRPWIHEGHADWMAGLLMRESGQLDAERWRERLDIALNNCQIVRGDKPSATLPTGFGRGDDPYACGQVLMLLAQSARPRAGSPVDAAASLLRDSTAPIDAEAVARWADGGPAGAMHTLLLDPRQGFRGALLRDWSDLIDATPLKPGEPLPAYAQGRLVSALMRPLMAADCDDAISFWTQADHFRIDSQPACRVLRGNPNVRRVAGVSPFDDPVGAWQALRAACAAGRPIELTTDGEPMSLACPAPVPDMPIHEILRVRPQALARLGLGP